MFVLHLPFSSAQQLFTSSLATKLNKALSRFQREDPTFHMNIDSESEDLIISGMGELHLQIYVERLKRD